MRDCAIAAGPSPKVVKVVANKAVKAIDASPDVPNTASKKNPRKFTFMGQVLTLGGSKAAAVTPAKDNNVDASASASSPPSDNNTT